MDVREALLTRKATRAYLDRPVEEEKIRRILDAARHAPSGTNTQPWQVAVVRGETKRTLQEAMEAAFRGGQKGEMDYQYYPVKWEGPYRERRKACGLAMYRTLQIGREDRQRQLDQWAANYRAFDAPVMLLFFMDPVLETGSFLDYGMFLQSIMLEAVEEGLATCPQAALGEYPEIVKKTLGYPEESILICGMALGYEDTAALVNSYRTDREEVDTFTRFFE
ncbi:MAG TPA: nitroreductase [Sedimenticola thiotaurini]|uniref:Nitroreductase n=1 Tax=Sedimenticola thiotaurini TaxID=1543721 RepID=A0A831RNC0_9GAMM|nr:nitroreductase [Sedimenticola thiotaurini]